MQPTASILYVVSQKDTYNTIHTIQQERPLCMYHDSLRLVINVTSVACVKEAEKRAIVPGPEDLEGQAS